MPLAGRNAALKATGAVPVASTNNAATRSTGVGTGTGYVRINDVTRRHWSTSPTPILFRAAAGSTAAVSSTNFTINYVQGKFQWVSGDPTTGTYTIDTSYLTASNVSGGREWTLNTEQDMFEVSEFGSSGWKRYMPNLVGSGIGISKYWTDPAFFDLLNTSTKFVVELIVNSTAGWKYEAYARIVSDAVQTSVDSIVNETINMQADGPVYFTT